MNKKIFLLCLFVTIAGHINSTYPQDVSAQENNETLEEPILGREKIERLKRLRTLHKRLWQRLLQHKRCLITGPCTKKEMSALKSDIKKLILATIATVVGVYVIRHQRSTVERAGEKPVWWKLPAQYVGVQRRKFEKAKKSVEKIGKMVGDVGEEGIDIKSGFGTIQVKPGQKKPQQAPQKGWMESGKEWWYGQEEPQEQQPPVSPVQPKQSVSPVPATAPKPPVQEQPPKSVEKEEQSGWWNIWDF